VLLLIGAPVIAAPAPLARPDRKGDLARLQGEWEWEYPNGGVERVTISGDRISWHLETGRVRSTATFRLRHGTPKAIDMTWSGVWTLRGIYRRQGGAFVIRSATRQDVPPPSTFDGPDNGDRTTYTLRRKR
jgi:hypothetical protein